MAEPPSELGAVHVTVAVPPLTVAVTFFGAVGTPAVVTSLEAAEAGELPLELVATTVNV